MSNINLLPPELTLGSSSLKLSKLIKKVNTVLIIVIILSVTIVAGSFLLFNTQKRVAKNDQKEVEAKIAVLKETEQRLVLIRDRLGKISKVLANESTDLESLKDIQANDQIILREADVKGKTSQIDIGATSLKVYAEFLNKLINSNKYSEIVMSSFSYSPRSGYDSNINLTQNDEQE